MPAVLQHAGCCCSPHQVKLSVMCPAEPAAAKACQMQPRPAPAASNTLANPLRRAGSHRQPHMPQPTKSAGYVSHGRSKLVRVSIPSTGPGTPVQCALGGAAPASQPVSCGPPQKAGRPEQAAAPAAAAAGPAPAAVSAGPAAPAAEAEAAMQRRLVRQGRHKLVQSACQATAADPAQRSAAGSRPLQQGQKRARAHAVQQQGAQQRKRSKVWVNPAASSAGPAASSSATGQEPKLGQASPAAACPLPRYIKTRHGLQLTRISNGKAAATPQRLLKLRPAHMLGGNAASTPKSTARALRRRLNVGTAACGPVLRPLPAQQAAGSSRVPRRDAVKLQRIDGVLYRLSGVGRGRKLQRQASSPRAAAPASNTAAGTADAGLQEFVARTPVSCRHDLSPEMDSSPAQKHILQKAVCSSPTPAAYNLHGNCHQAPSLLCKLDHPAGNCCSSRA